MNDLSLVLVTYNEEERIGRFLAHAKKWANGVTIFDKSSTDRTVEIARGYGASIRSIDFSPAGYEDTASLFKTLPNSWHLLCTPSDVPTRELIDMIRDLGENILDYYDAVIIQRKTFLLGEHIPSGHWGMSMIPLLFHPRKADFDSDLHIFVSDKSRIYQPVYSDKAYILHQTHATSASFLYSHVDYALGVSMNKDPISALKYSKKALRNIRLMLSRSFRISIHYHAWMMYHHSICMATIMKLEGRDIESEYSHRLEAVIREDWGEE